MKHAECTKTSAAANSLNRWCLRALHQSCDSMLYNTMHSQQCERPLIYARHQGPPPLRYSCIAPYCQEWILTTEEAGYCAYRQRFGAADSDAAAA